MVCQGIKRVDSDPAVGVAAADAEDNAFDAPDAGVHVPRGVGECHASACDQGPDLDGVVGRGATDSLAHGFDHFMRLHGDAEYGPMLGAPASL